MMASDKDILGKADALLRKHSGTGSDTGVFPVLTDLIDSPGERASDAELSREIAASVMAEVDTRLGAALGELRTELAALVEQAVAAALERRNVK